jgi:hypothetical protein
MGKGGSEALFTDKRDITGSNERPKRESKMDGIRNIISVIAKRPFTRLSECVISKVS